MKVIGFLTPYRHIKEFKALVSSKYTCLDLSTLTQDEQLDSFKHCDYLFTAPNYQKFEITTSGPPISSKTRFVNPVSAKEVRKKLRRS